LAIDFTKPDLALAYLVEGEFHVPGRFDDVVQRVFWCGPTARTGSGLTTPDPAALGPRATDRGFINWVGRLSRCSLDATLGNLKEHVQAMSDVSFTVAFGAVGVGGKAHPRGLSVSTLEGRWANKSMAMWLYDMDSGDFQQVAVGRWDRDPTNIKPGSFRVSAALELIPPGALWPMTKIPTAVPENWSRDPSVLPNTTPGSYWFPNTYGQGRYAISDQHAGVHVGHVFGIHGYPDPTDSSPGSGEGIWREIVPYGQADQGPFAQIFAHVSPSATCWVQEVYFIDNGGEVVNVANDVSGGLIAVFENTDPNRGPIGTNVRFTATNCDPSSTATGSYAIGVGGKVYARLAGRNFALRPPGWDQNNNPWLGFVGIGSPQPDLIGPPRAEAGEIFEDAFESPELLGIPDALGTNAIADFQAQYPSAIRSFKQMCCAVPLEVGKDPIDFAEVIGDLARTVPCDLVARFDPAVEEMRLYPIWRGPRPGQAADHTFTEADLANSSTISLTLLDDPDGTYNNSFTHEPPPHFLRGTRTVNATDERQAAVIDVEDVPIQSQTVDSVEEQGFAHFGGVRAETEKSSYWIRWKPAHSIDEPGEHEGAKLAAFYVAEERQQKQRVITARHGFQSFRVQMGEVIQYQIPGVWDALGMVRAMRYNLDAQTVEIRSYHVDVLGRTRRSPETAVVGVSDEERDRRDGGTR